MSAPEDSTAAAATAKSAPELLQNVVPAASASATSVPSSSAAATATAAAAAAAAAGAAAAGAGAPGVTGVAGAVPATSATTVSAGAVATSPVSAVGSVVAGSTSVATAAVSGAAVGPSGSSGSTNGSNNSNSGADSSSHAAGGVDEDSAPGGIKATALSGGTAVAAAVLGAASGEYGGGASPQPSVAPGGCDTPLSSVSPSTSLSPTGAGSSGGGCGGGPPTPTLALSLALPVPAGGEASALKICTTATVQPVAGVAAAAAAAAIAGCPPSSSSSSSLDSVASHSTPRVSNGGAAGDAVAGLSNLSARGRDAAGDKQHHSLEYHCRMLEEELQSVKESETKVKQQYIESQRRERFLARRLAVKEQEMQDYANQIAELKSAQAPGPAALRSALLDPAINILFQKLKAELQATKAKLEETQNELSAWKFTPDSNTGKRLMAKCRLLYQENEELGKMTSNGRLAKLENELSLQKSYNEEVKKSQLELDDFLQELDEDVEGMQSTIVFLQQELKQTKDSRDELEKEVTQLRAYASATSTPVANPTPGSTPTDEHHLKVAAPAVDNSSVGAGAYHPRPDVVGGRVTDSIGGGIMPIYLVNGGASSTNPSRLVANKSSNSGGGGGGGAGVDGDDRDVVYNNRTHCGGAVVVNSSELRTAPPIHGHGGLSAAPAVPLTPAAGETSATAPATGSSASSASSAAVNGAGVAGVGVAMPKDDGAAVAAGDGGGDALVNELKDPQLTDSDDSRTRCGNTIHNSVNSANNNSVKPQLQQQQQPIPPQQHHDQQHQQQRVISSNNGGRNGGRTTVAARKRNYNDTEGDSLTPEGCHSGSESVGGVGGVHSVAGVAVVGDSVAVPNGKQDSSATPDQQAGPTQQQQQQQQDAMELSSAGGNKRMTRSGKGKVSPAQPVAIGTGASTGPTSSSATISPSTNALMTSAAKKLRRGSVTLEEENDPLAADTPQQQQAHHTQQTISSANGSN